jgi:hypothetical protein
MDRSTRFDASGVLVISSCANILYFELPRSWSPRGAMTQKTTYTRRDHVGNSSSCNQPPTSGPRVWFHSRLPYEPQKAKLPS